VTGTIMMRALLFPYLEPTTRFQSTPMKLMPLPPLPSVVK
jgi:hypothetical protein